MKSEYGDLRTLTFSQAHGYEEIPQQLKLEELSNLARMKVWNVLFACFGHEAPEYISGNSSRLDILRDIHMNLDNLPLDRWNYSHAMERLRRTVMAQPFNKVFDLVQFILRHPQCPGLVNEMKEAFEEGMVAYVIDDNGPPTIFPASTAEEGKSLIRSLRTLQQAGLGTAAGLFRKAATDINREDWTGSIRNSISALESVARKLNPQAKTFGDALREIRRNSSSLWPSQLVQAMQNIWNYTNQKNTGIRHGSPSSTDTSVGQEEALFMLGVCASIASYLRRKGASKQNP